MEIRPVDTPIEICIPPP